MNTPASIDANGPTRHEIETLCILHAVGSDGCSQDDLAARLGMSPSLASIIADSAMPLVDSGLLQCDEFALSRTIAGTEFLNSRTHHWLGNRK